MQDSLRIQDSNMHRRRRRQFRDTVYGNFMNLINADIQITEPLENVKQIFETEENANFKVIDTYGPRYSKLYNLGDFYLRRFNYEFQMFASGMETFSIRKMRNVVLKTAVRFFAMKYKYISHPDFFDIMGMAPVMVFQLFCESHNIVYPNFVVLEIEKFMMLNWMFIHPNNYFRTMMELCLKNMEKILLIDWIMYVSVNEMLSRTPEKNMNFKPFVIEHAREPNNILLIDNLVVKYYSHLEQKEKMKVDDRKSGPMQMLHDIDLPDEVCEIFKQETKNFVLKDANRLLATNKEAFDNIPYVEIWQFISEITSEGLEFSMIAYILLSVKSGSMFIFR